MLLSTIDNPLFIAEVSSNHNQSLERCLQFVDIAADIGCDAIKFQLFRIHEMFTSEVLHNSDTHQRRKNWELPVNYIPEIVNQCKKRNILFGCTPFYLEAVDSLYPYVDFFKIASYELLWEDLITKAASTKKPILLSTGMANIEEIQQAVNWIQSTGNNNYLLFHCVSHYPTKVEECNLSVLQTMRNKFTCPVGWSDHSVTPGVIYRAVHRWSAKAIEFHLDIDGKGVEYEGGHCWLPQNIQPVIAEIRDSFSCDGNGNKRPVESELLEREWRADPSDGLRPLLSQRKMDELNPAIKTGVLNEQ